MLGFWASDLVLIGVQAGLVAGPRPAVPALLGRLRAWVWAAVLPASLGGTVALLALAPGLAGLYTWLALVAVPLLTVPAVRSWTGEHTDGWVGAAVVTAALFAIAWTVPGLAGQGAAVALSALSCATLATCLGELAPVLMLKVGVVVMAALDAVLVFGQLLEGPNAHLNAAAPGAGLPQLQVAVFGSVALGYGDLFVAAVFGVVLARGASRAAGRRRPQVFALVTLACSAVFDLLFLVVGVLPATVPVAVAMLIGELRSRRWDRREALGPGCPMEEGHH